MRVSDPRERALHAPPRADSHLQLFLRKYLFMTHQPIEVGGFKMLAGCGSTFAVWRRRQKRAGFALYPAGRYWLILVCCCLTPAVITNTSAPTCTAGEYLECESREEPSKVGWDALRRTLGEFQPPPALDDYASFQSERAPSRHFYQRGTALDAEGRVEEALAAFERAVEIDPTDSAHWNNVGVAAMRQQRDAEFNIALPSLEGALRRDPENRLAVANHQLPSAISQLRRDGPWGTNLGPLQSPSQRVWCQDDDAAVAKLSRGQYETCCVAAAAAERFGNDERSAAVLRAVCLVCPAACQLCPAPEAWVAQWWNISTDYTGDSSPGTGVDDGSGGDDVSSASSASTGSASPDHDGMGPTHCTIERRSAASLSPAEFAEKYAVPRIPVLLSGMLCCVQCLSSLDLLAVSSKHLAAKDTKVGGHD